MPNPFESQAKKMVHILMRKYEQAYLELTLLKLMLQTSDNPHIRDNWQPQLNELLANPKYAEPLRTEFAPLYAAIDAAMDEATALGILQKIPPVRRVN